MKTFGHRNEKSTRVCTHPNRERRRQDALARKEEYSKLSLQEKYDRAVTRGHENTKEAKRLRALIEASANSQPAGEGAGG